MVAPAHTSTALPASRAGFFFERAKRDATARKLHKALDAKQQAASSGDFVDNLIANNQDVWNKYINHSFPQMMANGSAPLDGFRNYMIQDKLYLEEYLRAKMSGAATAQSFDEVESFVNDAPSTAKYVRDANNTIVTELGVPQNVIDNTKHSEQLIASTKFYTDVTDGNISGATTTTDTWYDIHVALVPCIVGYATIAQKILNAQSTVRNTPYYPLWVEYNSGESSVTEYKQFLNDNYGEYYTGPDADAKWTKIFREACGHETNFLDLGLSSPEIYHIVADGEYNIYHFASGGSLGVNTHQSNRATLKAQAAASAADSWRVIATTSGYTIQNVNTNFYLKAEDDNTVSMSIQPAFWWINPAPSAPGTIYFQVMVVDKLQLCLSTEATVADPAKPLTCASNNGVGAQFWSFVSTSTRD